jgi:membrane protease YdiL (CAAX protease family)
MSSPVPPRPDLWEPTADDGLAALPTVTWRWWEVVIVGLVGIAVASAVTLPLSERLGYDPLRPPGTGGLLITLVFDALWAGVFALWLQLAHRGWPTALWWPPRRRVPRELALGIGLGIALYVGSAIVFALLRVLLEAASGRPVRTPVQVEPSTGPAGILVLLLVAMAVAPAVEEFIFRGLLFRSLADRYGFWAGAIPSAIVFGLVHDASGGTLGLWALKLTLVFVGIALALVYRWRRTLLTAIAAHAAFNVVGVVLLLGTRA